MLGFCTLRGPISLDGTTSSAPVSVLKRYCSPNTRSNSSKPGSEAALASESTFHTRTPS